MPDLAYFFHNIFLTTCFRFEYRVQLKCWHLRKTFSVPGNGCWRTRCTEMFLRCQWKTATWSVNHTTPIDLIKLNIEVIHVIEVNIGFTLVISLIRYVDTAYTLKISLKTWALIIEIEVFLFIFCCTHTYIASYKPQQKAWEFRECTKY